MQDGADSSFLTGHVGYVIALAVCDASRTLLIGDWASRDTKVVAVDISDSLFPVTRWSLSSELKCCAGLVVVPPPAEQSTSSSSIAVCSSLEDDMLKAVRVSDGLVLSKCASREYRTTFTLTYLAAHGPSRTIFASTSSVVRSFTIGLSGALSPGKVVEASVDDPLIGFRPITVVPESPGRSGAFLVIGRNTCGDLLVLSLPDLTLVHSHSVGLRVAGLAADSSGSALAVCDAISRDVHVLPWPLPGMGGV